MANQYLFHSEDKKSRWSFDLDAIVITLVVALVVGPYFLLIVYAGNELAKRPKEHPDQKIASKAAGKREVIFVGRGRYFYK
jgi:hypothetical protein